jgi:hypothetical protein
LKISTGVIDPAAEASQITPTHVIERNEGVTVIMLDSLFKVNSTIVSSLSLLPETPMNAVCIKRGPTTGFRDFNIVLHTTSFSPKARKPMGKFARFKVSKMKQVGVWIDRVSTRSFSNKTYDRGYDNSAICIYISRGRHGKILSVGVLVQRK